MIIIKNEVKKNFNDEPKILIFLLKILKEKPNRKVYRTSRLILSKRSRVYNTRVDWNIEICKCTSTLVVYNYYLKCFIILTIIGLYNSE